MNKDDILTDEHQLAILIRDAMSEFRKRRLGPASQSDDQDEIGRNALEYAAEKYGPLDESASDRSKELRTKHVVDKANQVVARCEAAKRLYELSDELASLMAYCHQKVLSIKAALPAEPEPSAEPSPELIEYGRRTTMDLLNKARIRDLVAKVNQAHGMGRMKAEDEVLGWIKRLVELTQPETEPEQPEPEDTADDPYNEYPQDFTQ